MDKTSAVDTVVNGLRGDIADGRIKSGDRFPSERFIAEQYGVSRNTVREAIRYFEFVGLAETRRGSGTYLVNNGDAMSDLMDARQIVAKYNFSEMVEARRIVEIGIVQLAAKNVNRDEKIHLHQMLDYLESLGDGYITTDKLDELMAYDYELHHEIAKMTHNSFLIEMHVALKGVILSSIRVWKSGDSMSDAVNPYHRPLIEAICANDPAAAAEAMSNHLDHIESWMAYAESHGKKPITIFDKMVNVK